MDGLADFFTLPEFLTWLISGGGSLVAAYWLMENVAWLKDNITPEYKRYASIGIASALGCGGLLVSVGLGYRPAPEDAKAWLEAVFAVIGLAVTGSQIAHGRLKLRAR